MILMSYRIFDLLDNRGATLLGPKHSKLKPPAEILIEAWIAAVLLIVLVVYIRRLRALSFQRNVPPDIASLALTYLGQAVNPVVGDDGPAETVVTNHRFRVSFATKLGQHLRISFLALECLRESDRQSGTVWASGRIPRAKLLGVTRLDKTVLLNPKRELVQLAVGDGAGLDLFVRTPSDGLHPFGAFDRVRLVCYLRDGGFMSAIVSTAGAAA